MLMVNARTRNAVFVALSILLCLSPVALFANGQQEEDGGTVLRYAEVNTESDPITQGAYHFGERLSELTDGRYEVEVVPGGALGGHETTMRLTATGSIQATRTNAFFLAEEGIEMMEALSLPFLFQSLDHAWEVMNGSIGEEVLQNINENYDLGYHAIGFLIAPPRHYFFVDEPVTSVDDMEGLTMRVPAGPLADATEAFGASPTVIDFGELYSALETGVVDGAEQPVKGYYTQAFYEVTDYLTYTNHQIDSTVVVINQELWDSLSDEDREAFNTAFEDAQQHYRELEAENRAEYEEELVEEHGVELLQPDDPSEWSEAVSDLYEQYPDYLDLIERIQAAAE